jgi:hypothetical protein
MFHTAVCRRISPAALFLQQSKGKFASRAATWKAYAALSVAEKEQLRATAAAVPFTHTEAYHVKTERLFEQKVERKMHRQLKYSSKYSEFTKANYKQVAHLPVSKRLRAIGKLWRKSNKIEKVTEKKKEVETKKEEGSNAVRTWLKNPLFLKSSKNILRKPAIPSSDK